MKRYIRANTTLSQGAYLLDRNGDMYETFVHAPSTTFLDRCIFHLVPTDAEFLLRIGKISEEDAETVLAFCFAEYLIDQKGYESSHVASVLDVSAFNSYAEMRYAPSTRRILMTYPGKFTAVFNDRLVSDFEALTAKWYRYLKNNFVKISVFNNVVEFRIGSEDDFDWNSVIIDYGILQHDRGTQSSTKYTIVRESSKGYKAYFLNASIDDILENDSTVLSDTLLERKVVASRLVYTEK